MDDGKTDDDPQTYIADLHVFSESILPKVPPTDGTRDEGDLVLWLLILVGLEVVDCGGGVIYCWWWCLEVRGVRGWW